jgi:anti-sigma factor ChrR (cupin superfamily)
MLPGTRLPAHRHIGAEQFFILEGDCNVHGQSLGPGDFHIAASDTVHESTYTVNGTLFLLIGPRGYEILGS